MKYKLTQTEFENLDETTQNEYSLNGDTAILNLEGEGAPTPDYISGLEKKREIEVEHRKNAEAKVKEADDRAAQLQKNLENAGGNKEEIQKIKDAHAKEIETLRQEREAEAAKVKQSRDNSLKREVADEFSKRFTVPHLIGPQFSNRLSVEEVDGKPVVRVLAEDGSASTASLADLQKEFLDNPAHKEIIVAKTGSGGGATHTPGSGGGATVKKLSQMTATEEAAFERENPDAYAAALKDNS